MSGKDRGTRRAETQAGSPVGSPNGTLVAYHVLVVDDHPLIRTMVGDEPDLEIAGEVKDGREAVGSCG